MSNPSTIDPDTELSAVNTILGAIGQSPVTTLGEVDTVNNISTYQNPEIAFIYNLLKECNMDVQNEGWHFNTEYHCHRTADSSGYITFDTNALRMDFSNPQDKFYDVVKRNGRLYDKVNHTDEFTPGQEYTVDIVWLFEYGDLPAIFKRLVTYKAAGRAATQLVTNQQLVQLLALQEQSARAACMEYECNQGDHNFFGYPHESSFNTYKPYIGLAR